MRKVCVVARSVMVCGCLFASGTWAGTAAAQSAEPVGAPLQLLPFVHQGKAETKPHNKIAARSTVKSAARSSSRSSDGASDKASDRASAKSSARTRVASRHKLRSHTMVAERTAHPPQPAPQATPATAPAPDAAWPAAPTAATADATTLAPVQQTPVVPTPAVPQIVPPVSAGTPNELVVDGQTIQVASADQANEIDLAANDAGVASDASLGAASARPAVPTEPPEAAASSKTTRIAFAQTPRAEVGSTSWLLQVLAALGGAVAAGVVAWFLMGSSPQRMYG
jgi:hypothetical protein